MATNPLAEQTFKDGATIKLWASDMGEVCLTLTDSIPDGEVHFLTRNARAVGKAIIAMADALDAERAASDASAARH